MQVQVRQRARALCEYCQAEQWQYVPFTVDHIVPLALDGTTTLENLALACFHSLTQGPGYA
jgi:5-methylcytosine-specific restriction endonuclease McrA